MRNGVNCLALAGLLSLSVASPVQADRLLVEDLREVGSASSDTTPRLGQTMEQVEQRYGTPRERVEAVGSPPIGRWVYDGYTVYFESDRVLHTVLQR